MSNKNNMNKKGLLSDVDWGFILPSLIVLIVIAIPAVLWEEKTSTALNAFFGGFVNSASWLMVLLPVLMIGVCFWWIFSKYGNIVLGDPNEKPFTSNFTYLCTLTCSLYGATVMRTGSAQWALVAADPLFGVEAFTQQAIQQGQAYSMYMWSLPMAGIYAITTPCIAYFVFNRKSKNMRYSAMCRDLLGDKFADGIGGKIVDIIFIVSLVLGTAVFIGMCSPMLSTVVAKLCGIEASFTLDVIVTIAMAALFTCSAFRGMKKGIEALSRINIILLFVLVAFILITGPGLFILNMSVDSLGEFVANYPRFLLATDAIGQKNGTMNGTVAYTVSWWAYCFSWSLISSTFVAIASKGRTIREMMIYFIVSQCFAAIPVTSVLGGAGIDAHMNGLVDMIADVNVSMPYAIANMLSVQKFAPVAMVIFGLLAFAFMGTSMDSCTYTISSYTSKVDISNTAPSKSLRLMWAVLMAGPAVVLMYLGGLGTLEAVSAISGFPVMFVVVLVVIAGKKMMDNDKAWIAYARPKDWDPDTAPVAKRADGD